MAEDREWLQRFWYEAGRQAEQLKQLLAGLADERAARGRSVSAAPGEPRP